MKVSWTARMEAEINSSSLFISILKYGVDDYREISSNTNNLKVVVESGE